MFSRGFRGVWIAVALVVSVPLLAHFVRHGAPLPIYSGEGFAAFYCAGDALRQGRDPYRTEPLRTCEAATGAVPGGVAEPAPLPPVTLAFFSSLAHLPFRTASAVWLGSLALSVVVTGLILVRLAPRVPPVAIWTALVPGLVILNGYYGETPPLVAAALALAGYALHRGPVILAVAGVTVAAALEPHVGGAAWLALLFYVPRARLPLVLTVLALAAISIVGVGFGTALEYVTRVLPAHAVSELPARDQYSLSSILFALGASARIATIAGSLSYAVALVAGLIAAPRAARAFAAPELIAFLPAGAVLIGGAFLHDLQISLALPLVVVAAHLGTRVARPLAFAILLVAAVPETASATTYIAFGAAAAFAAAWSVPTVGGSVPWFRSRYAFGAGGTIAYAGFAALVHRLGAVAIGAHAVPATATSAAPNALAEVDWTAYVTAVSTAPNVGDLLTKVTVDVLLIVTFCVLAAARRAGSSIDSKLPGNSVA